MNGACPQHSRKIVSLVQVLQVVKVWWLPDSMTIAIESVNAAVVVVLYCYTISVVSAVFCLIETPYNLIPFDFHFRFSYFRFRLVSVFLLFLFQFPLTDSFYFRFLLFPFSLTEITRERLTFYIITYCTGTWISFLYHVI
jgi:hypothetical protein